MSNLLRWLLRRYEKWTLGVLLGLVIGAPAGLYPFKRGVEPQTGDSIRGVQVTPENIEEMLAKPSRWIERGFAPSAGQVGGALGLIVLGGGITLGIASLGRGRAREGTRGDDRS